MNEESNNEINNPLEKNGFSGINQQKGLTEMRVQDTIIKDGGSHYTGATTEWEDIHVQKGNWKAKEHVATSEEVFLAQQETVQNYDNWVHMNKKQLDEACEDDWELEDDDIMKEYQAKRMAEMESQATQHKFHGGMIDITKQDYEWHCNNMPKETLGVILMYQDQ